MYCSGDLLSPHSAPSRIQTLWGITGYSQGGSRGEITRNPARSSVGPGSWSLCHSWGTVSHALSNAATRDRALPTPGPLSQQAGYAWGSYRYARACVLMPQSIGTPESASTLIVSEHSARCPRIRETRGGCAATTPATPLRLNPWNPHESLCRLSNGLHGYGSLVHQLGVG